MQRVSDILSNLGEVELHILSLEKLSLSKQNAYFYPVLNLFSLCKTLLQLRKINFDIILGCNVDNIYFQLMLKFLKYHEFHSFDEGHIALRDSKWELGNLDGIVYIDEFSVTGQRRWYLLNKLTGFPLPWGKVWDLSKVHYTFFNPEIVRHPLSKKKEVTYIKRRDLDNKIERVFLGVNSFWSWTDDYSKRGNPELYNQALQKAADRINSLQPNLYLMHPREGSDLIKLLDHRIILLKNMDGNEIFLNSLHKSSPITVYTVMSGSVYDLITDIEVRYVNLFNRFDKDTYSKWINEFNEYRKGIDPKASKAHEINFDI
tara:strand:+ start:31628 stop:32578 length:951 start_codon:yes stop_codon:yes gene_type:complete